MAALYYRVDQKKRENINYFWNGQEFLKYHFCIRSAFQFHILCHPNHDNQWHRQWTRMIFPTPPLSHFQVCTLIHTVDLFIVAYKIAVNSSNLLKLAYCLEKRPTMTIPSKNNKLRSPFLWWAALSIFCSTQKCCSAIS